MTILLFEEHLAHAKNTTSYRISEEGWPVNSHHKCQIIRVSIKRLFFQGRIQTNNNEIHNFSHYLVPLLRQIMRKLPCSRNGISVQHNIFRDELCEYIKCSCAYGKYLIHVQAFHFISQPWIISVYVYLNKHTPAFYRAHWLAEATLHV